MPASGGLAFSLISGSKVRNPCTPTNWQFLKNFGLVWWLTACHLRRLISPRPIWWYTTRAFRLGLLRRWASCMPILDVNGARKPRQVRTQEAVGSFQEIAESWLKRHVEANKLRSRPEIERQLNKYVFPGWKGRRFLDIRRREVKELLDHIADKHGRSQADAVLATLRGMMAWHQSRDENYTSPIVRGMRRKKPSRRERILSDEQIRAVWRACDEINGTFGGLIKVLLTAQRREKVASMRWADLKGGFWTVPEEERRKAQAATQSAKVALDAIEAQPHVVGNPHVFAARGKGSFSSFSHCKEELDHKLSGMEPWTLHDLIARRAF